jgi:hypothetical protein
MTKLKINLLNLLLLLSLAQAHAEDKLPAAVKNELSKLATFCRSAGGTPINSPELLATTDLTGDGLSDYVIDEGAFVCRDAYSIFGGTAGSMVSVYVSTNNGEALKAFEVRKHEIALDKSVHPTKLSLSVEGESCGQRITAETFHREYLHCWRSVIWNNKQRKMTFAPLSQIEIIK